MQTHSMPFDFSVPKPTPRRLIPDTLLSCIIAQFHEGSVPDYAEIVKDSLEFLGTFSIRPRSFLRQAQGTRRGFSADLIASNQRKNLFSYPELASKSYEDVSKTFPGTLANP